MSTSFPSRPWERVGVDLFELHGKVYIVIVDYFSRWVEYRKLTSLTSEHTIEELKEVFATHGIPDLILTQFPSRTALHTRQVPRGFHRLTVKRNEQ